MSFQKGNKLSLRHGHTTHKTKSREYQTWQNMKARCLSSSWPSYDNYGGRGIKVCDRWLKFENFIEDMGPKPKGMSLDRIDNDGDYCPENCRWSTKREQDRNRRTNHNLTCAGEIHCVTEWAEILGISKHTIWGRLRNGWSVEKTLTTPARKKRKCGLQ